ncbi:MAG: O-antigen ligase family protein [Planctomycetaceae bacterium]|nr:O-antigen ligase family protein [Planctomycetaceae bacterium]
MLVAGLYVSIGYSLLMLNIETSDPRLLVWQERAANRWVRPANPISGPLSGRSTIWGETWDLFADRPLFGYGFEPYSERATFDTPHQQYLEVLYKCGLVGMALYACVLSLAFVGLVRQWRASIPLHGPGGGRWFDRLSLVSDETNFGRVPIEPVASVGQVNTCLPYAPALLALFCGVMIGNFSQSNLTYSLTGNCLFLLIGLTIPVSVRASTQAKLHFDRQPEALQTEASELSVPRRLAA